MECLPLDTVSQAWGRVMDEGSHSLALFVGLGTALDGLVGLIWDCMGLTSGFNLGLHGVDEV